MRKSTLDPILTIDPAFKYDYSIDVRLDTASLQCFARKNPQGRHCAYPTGSSLGLTFPSSIFGRRREGGSTLRAAIADDYLLDATENAFLIQRHLENSAGHGIIADSRALLATSNAPWVWSRRAALTMSADTSKPR
jgi:hypothetical protein